MAPRRLKVIWSENAQSDLDEAISWIATSSRSAAIAHLERVLAAAASLTELPDRGRVVPELDDSRFRELILSPHRLIYFRTGSSVWIVAFIHTSREFTRHAADL